jgi:hypothetical protein
MVIGHFMADTDLATGDPSAIPNKAATKAVEILITMIMISELDVSFKTPFF